MKSFRNSFLTIDTKPFSCDYNQENSDNKKILIADKDLKTAESLKNNLVSQGYEILVVDRWKSLIYTVKGVDISIVFLDIKLIDIKGYKLIPIIQKIRPDVYIVITNKSNSIKIESLVRDYNVFFYYLKPYDMKEIKLLVKNIYTYNFKRMLK